MERINILKRYKYLFPRDTLNTVYFTTIRSVMEYMLVQYFTSKTVALLTS
jgi:hypothetical protein